MEIRKAQKDDLKGLLELYAQFGSSKLPAAGHDTVEIWAEILSDRRQEVIVALENGVIVSSCVLIIVPNLTHSGRPYALVENVITDEKHRNTGYATSVLNAARDIAVGRNCYKIMLMTGSKLDGTLRFYERVGYNSTDKTAFIQWL